MNCTVKYMGSLIGHVDLKMTDPSMGVAIGRFSLSNNANLLECLNVIMNNENLIYQTFDEQHKCIDTGPLKNVQVTSKNGISIESAGMHFLGFLDDFVELEIYGVSNWEACTNSNSKVI